MSLIMTYYVSIYTNTSKHCSKYELIKKIRPATAGITRLKKQFKPILKPG